MPTDPERPIERLLRREAARRREQAGTPPGLHPVTRRLLQSEVRKMYAAQPAARPSRFSFFKPAWGWALGAATALLMLSSVMFFLDKGAQEEPVRLAMDKEERYPDAVETAAAPTAPTATPAPATRALISERRYGAYEESLARGAVVAATSAPTLAFADSLTPGLAPAFRPESLEKKALDVAAPSVASVAESVSTDFFGYARRSVAGLAGIAEDDALRLNEGLVTTNVDLRDSVLVQTTAGKPFEMLADAGKLEREPSRLMAGRTAQPLTGTTLATKAKAVEAAPQPADAAPQVLASFQVEQVGQSLRIIDSDGSVYTGDLLVATAEKEAVAEAATRARRMAVADRSADIAPTQTASVTQRTDQNQNQNVAFRVSGTNRSLRQNVVFSGNLAGPPLPPGLQFANNVVVQSANNTPAQFGIAAASNVSQTSYFAGAAFLQQNREQLKYSNQQQLPSVLLQNSISGQATLGDGRKVEVNAVPVSLNQR